MQYVQVQKVVSKVKQAKMRRSARLQNSITQMRTAAEAVTSLQVRMASARR